MKSVKIILALAVVGLIGFFVIKSMVIVEKIAEVGAAKNEFTEHIDKEITALSTLPDNNFSKGSYMNVKSLIDDYSRPHPPQYPFGRLGDSQLENNERKEIFSKNLYAAYAQKFIIQAFYVFNNAEWKIENLTFIRSEYEELRNSQFLEIGSPVDINLSEIQRILRKYDEINSFIATTESFSFSDYSLDSKFPFSDLQNKISRIDTYKNNNLGNTYVNNCARLHNQLDSNKKILINSYLKYLENKIGDWTGRYNQFQFNSFNEYRNIIYNPLKNELDEFKTNCNINNYSYETNRYNALLRRLNTDSEDAFSSIN